MCAVLARNIKKSGNVLDAFLKSVDTTKISFLQLLTKLSIRKRNTKIWSVVLELFIKPT